MNEEKNCITCKYEDNDRSEWPCNKCDLRYFEWQPKPELSELEEE